MNDEADAGPPRLGALRPRAKRVLVLGSGLSALAAALAAARAGHIVELAGVRVADGMSTEGPDPLHVPPGMLRDLVALGVGEACVAAGFPFRHTSRTDAAARIRSVEETPRLAGPLFPSALGLSRAALAQILMDALRAQGLKHHQDVCCVRVEQRSGRTHAAFDDGRYRRYGLVVAATPPAAALGAPALASASASRFIEQVTWATVVHGLAELDQPITTACAPGGSVTALPLGAMRAAVLLTVPGEAVAPPIAGRARRMRQPLDGLDGVFAKLREQIVDDAAVQVCALYSGVQPEPWYGAGVLLFGAAAHAVAPHLGQAEAQTFEDAVVLCDVLRETATNEEIAQRFMRRRLPRCHAAVDLARQAARWQVTPTKNTDFARLAATQAAWSAAAP